MSSGGEEGSKKRKGKMNTKGGRKEEVRLGKIILQLSRFREAWKRSGRGGIPH